MQELLVFARKTDAHLAEVDLREALRATLDLVQASLPPSIRVTCYAPEQLAPIMADAGQLDRILTNLLINARDAMPEGGTIHLTLDLVRFDTLPGHLHAARDVHFVRMRVTDTGTGMDEETQSRIFEPFYTTKPSGKGTGLGLSVVFGLMESHGGSSTSTRRRDRAPCSRFSFLPVRVCGITCR